jgi:DNA-binding CsgD family transcriptional regulator
MSTDLILDDKPETWESAGSLASSTGVPNGGSRLRGRARRMRLKKPERHQSPSNGYSFHAKEFVFFDKSTGARRFEVNADPDGRIPADKAASLLAVHCVARHQLPADFGVLVCVGEDLIDVLVKRATRLIESCSDFPEPDAPAQLTRRQSEVLDGIAQTLTNKEIASVLHLSERTVKFHVSSLFGKFHVKRRVDLMLEADGFLRETRHKSETEPRVPRAKERSIAPGPAGPVVIVAPPIPAQVRPHR